jgi:hypothetical protein
MVDVEDFGPDYTPPQHFPGLTAWLCEYDGPDGRYGIVLHGPDPASVIATNGVALPGLVVLGEHGGTIKGGTHD